MRPRPVGIIVTGALLLLVSAMAARAEVRYDFTAVDDALTALVADHDLPGCSLRLVVDGEVVYERAAGYSLEEIVPTASAAKWIAAAVVMAVVDAGYLDLDDTTAHWLGWTGEKGTITLRQLMSHTSGINGAASPCLGDPSAALADCVAEIEALPLIGPPGGQFVYGGNSMQVAGRMCEVAAGERPFVDLFAEFVGDPLGLTSTAYSSATNPRIAGGARTSLRDYSHLCEMWLGGGELAGVRVLSAASAAIALSDQTGGAPALSLPPCLPAFHGYGIGNWLEETPDGARSLENSSPGAFGLTPWIDPARGLAGTFLTATTADICGEIADLRQRIRDILDGPVTGIADGPGVVGLELGPVRQVPGGMSVVAFALPAAGRARISVVDLRGRRLATLVDGPVAAGRHTVRWDGRTRGGMAAPAGVYLVTIASGAGRLSTKLVRLTR